MGGSTFFDVRGGTDASDAFRLVTEEARYEYGHGGYTGTVAEKTRFVTIACPGVKDRLPTVAEVADLFDRLVEAGDRRIDDKWGPAGCTEVSRPEGETESPGRRWFAFYGWASS